MILIKWIKVSDQLPTGIKLCLQEFPGTTRKPVLVMAFYAKKFECETNDSEFYDYDEETELCYLPKGWYENIENWEDYNSVAIINGEITMWADFSMPAV